MSRVSSVRLRNGLQYKPIVKKVVGGSIGTVLLDGGFGGQSSYWSEEDYLNTTGRDLKTNKVYREQPIQKNVGKGLADRIGDSLGKLDIRKDVSRGVRKNIQMNF